MRLAGMLLLLLYWVPDAQAADADLIAGDALQFAIPAAALSISFIKDDKEGELQWVRNTAAAGAAMEISKLIFDNTGLGRRPNGGRMSFPSGHVTLAASGAAFLTERYGWEYGVGAWALTGFVAYSRVDEGYHHWWDCVAAGALAYGVSKLFVTPQSATHIAPIVGPDFIGLRWERSW